MSEYPETVRVEKWIINPMYFFSSREMHQLFQAMMSVNICPSDWLNVETDLLSLSGQSISLKLKSPKTWTEGSYFTFVLHHTAAMKVSIFPVYIVWARFREQFWSCNGTVNFYSLNSHYVRLVKIKKGQQFKVLKFRRGTSYYEEEGHDFCK